MKIKQRKLSPAQGLLVTFANAWQERFGMDYDIVWEEEMPWAKKLENANLTPDKFQAKMRLFFDDPRWWQYGKCGFKSFVKNLRELVPEPQMAAPKPADPWIACSGCGEVHRASEPCKVDPDVEVRPLDETLNELAKKMRM